MAALGFRWLTIIIAYLTIERPNGSCVVTIHPVGVVGLIVHENLTVTCKAIECHCDPGAFIGLNLFRSTSDGPMSNNVLCRTTLPIKDCNNCCNNLITSACSAKVDMSDNGTRLLCGIVRNDTINIYSDEVELLVQGALDSVTSLTVRRLTDLLLNISWDPVFFYTESVVLYNISLNETFDIVQSCTWTAFNATKVDQCEIASFDITPFINKTDQILVGDTSEWNIILHDALLSYTMIMHENGSVLIALMINNCNCSNIISSINLTLKNDTYSYSETVLVIPDSNCSGNASLMLSLYMNLELEVWLHYDGLTIQMEPIIDTNPLRGFNIINGTESLPPIIQCLFTDDVMITNKYSTGCVAYYTDMNRPICALKNNNETIAKLNTDINASGFYNISVMPLLPSLGHCLDLVYISVEPIKPSVTTYTVTLTSSISLCSPTSTCSIQTCLQKGQVLYAVIPIGIILCLGWPCCYVLVIIAKRCKNYRQYILNKENRGQGENRGQDSRTEAEETGERSSELDVTKENLEQNDDELVINDSKNVTDHQKQSQGTNTSCKVELMDMSATYSTYVTVSNEAEFSVSDSYQYHDPKQERSHEEPHVVVP